MSPRKRQGDNDELERRIASIKSEIQQVNSEFNKASASGDELALYSVRNASILKVFENCKAIAGYVSRCNQLMGESLERRVAGTLNSYSRMGNMGNSMDIRALQSWIKAELVPVVRLSESLGHVAALNINEGRKNDGSHSWKLQ